MVASMKEKFKGSPCWKAILIKLKGSYKAGRKVEIHSGNVGRPWKDPHC